MEMNGSNVMIGEREFKPVLFFMAEVVFGFPGSSGSDTDVLGSRVSLFTVSSSVKLKGNGSLNTCLSSLLFSESR